MKLNKGLSDYVQAQRDETLHRIDEAVIYLRNNGLPVTKKSIADELGIHYNSMKKKYITFYLLRYPEFNPDIQVQEKITNDQLEAELVSIRNILSKTKQANKNLSTENVKLRLEKKEILEKHQRLLGRYQAEVGRKIVPF